MSTAESPNAGTAIARYTPLETGILEFLAKHDNVVHDVATPKGLELAKKDRAECRSLRLRVEEARVAEKADALAYGRKVDSEAKRLTSIIAPAEEGYDQQIKVREQQIEAERQARIEAERNRVARIRDAIDNIKKTAGRAITMTAVEVETEIRTMVAEACVPEGARALFQEFADEAINAHAATLDFLRDLHVKKLRQEAEAAQIKADREQLERDKAAQEKREHEAKIEREARERKEADEREESERVARIAREAQERTERETRQREEADRLAKIDAEEKRQAAERDRLAAEDRRQEDERQRIAAAAEATAANERAEHERKEADERRQAAAKKRAYDRAALLKRFRRKTAAEALRLIGSIVDDPEYEDLAARDTIGIIVEANTPKEIAKATEAEQAGVRA